MTHFTLIEKQESTDAKGRRWIQAHTSLPKPIEMYGMRQLNPWKFVEVSKVFPVGTFADYFFCEEEETETHTLRVVEYEITYWITQKLLKKGKEVEYEPKL